MENQVFRFLIVYKIKNCNDCCNFIKNSDEPTTGLEPVTSSLPRKHSTAELSRQIKKSRL